MINLSSIWMWIKYGCAQVWAWLFSWDYPAVKVVHPVSMETFLDSPELLGHVGARLSADVRKLLVRIGDDVPTNSAVLLAKQSDRQLFLQTILCRWLYEHTIFEDMRENWGLSPGTSWLIPVIASDRPAATRRYVHMVARYLEQSPYFRDKFRYNLENGQILLHSGVEVQAFGLDASEFMGTNVMRFVITDDVLECASHRTVAEKIHWSLRSRVISRLGYIKHPPITMSMVVGKSISDIKDVIHNQHVQIHDV